MSTEIAPPQESFVPEGDPRLAAYAALVEGRDEMLGAVAQPGSPWRPVAQRFLEMAPAEVQDLVAATHRAIREHGITYSVHGDPVLAQRPWLLDPVPFVLSEADWDATEKGLKQRAELLDAILADLYGPQRLFQEGLLPPEVVYRHPGFLAACRGFEPAGGRRLFVYGTDMARGPDGRMWVINDRTQAPSGAGYAIENRVIIARLLPQLFKECGVRRLASLFRSFRDVLYDAARSERREPRVVLLTPGPFNETYFEHAYLAAYLGIDLVQGNDLTVRNARVWLKSLAGLEPVDVIVRRVDDLWCDPLELKSESQLGVPGLVEAARRGNVVIANPLGNGILESPALLAFLPGICRFLRGEDLLLPSAATWWCGQEQERRHVLDNLDRLVVKSIDRFPAARTEYAAMLSAQDLAKLRARIEEDPSRYVGQEMVSFASAPALMEGKLQPRRTILRSVVLAAQGGTYEVMPGGLTLSTTRSEGIAVSYSRDGIAKDSWVCSNRVEDHQSLWAERTQRVRGGGPHHLSSRAGENLFWVGRYAERVEAVARVVRRVLRIYYQQEDVALLADEQRLFSELRPALERLAWISSGAEDGAPMGLEEYLVEVTASQAPGSVCGNLRSLLQAAYGVRDLWSPDSWRIIGRIQEIGGRLGDPEKLFSVAAQEMDALIIQLVAFSGLNLESMTRDAGWVLLEVGRRLERSLAMISLVEAFVVEWRDDSLAAFRLESLLAASDSLVTHRRRYRVEPTPESVLELLLVDENNPRSLLYQLVRLEEQVENLPAREEAGKALPAETKLLLRRIWDLRLGELGELIVQDAKTGERESLRAWLDGLSRSLQELSDFLTRKYFILDSAHLRDQAK